MKYDNLRIAILFAFAFISTFVYSQPSIKIPEFKKSIQVFEQNDRTWEAAIADLNGDNFLDLVIANLGSETAVFFYDGYGLLCKSKQQFQPELHGVAIGDIDGDGDLDLFFSALRKGQSSPIYINNGKGVFEKAKTSFPIENGEKVQLIDVDNDGDLDAYIWWGGFLYINDGKGNFEYLKLYTRERIHNLFE